MSIKYIIRNFLYAFIAMILFYSCNDDKGARKTLQLETFKIDPNLAQCISIDSIYIDEEKIPLATSDTGLIGIIFDFHVSKKRFYMLTQNHQVFSFSKAGELIYKIDKKGKGPTEYVFPRCLYPDPEDKFLEIFNRGSKNVVVLDSNGNYISDWKYDLYISKATHYKGLTCMLVGSVLNYIDNKESNMQLFVYDNSHNLQESYLPFNKEYWKFLGIGDRIDMVHVNDNLHVRVLYNDTVYCLSKNENIVELKPKYLFNYGKFAIPNELFEKGYSDVSEFRRELIKEGCIYYVYRFLETDEHIFFSFKIKKTLYFYYYSKITKQAIVVDKMIVPFKGFVYKRKLEFKDIPWLVHNNFLYFIKEPNDYIKELKKIEKNLDNKEWEKFKKNNREYYEFVKSLTMIDNPIIVKRKINKELFN